MKPKKILLLSDFAFPVAAGTERLVFGIANWFTNNYDIKTDILCPDWNNRGNFEESNGVKIHRFKTHSIYRANPIKRTFDFVMHATALGKYDVYAGFYTMPPLVSAVIASKIKGTSSSATFFGREQLEKNFRNPIKKALLISTFQQADIMTSYTWNLKDYLSKIFPGKKILVTPGFSEQRFSTSRQVKGKDKTVLFVGRMNEEKGIFVLLEAFAKIYKKTNAKLVLAGAPYEQELVEKKIVDLGISDSVKVLGFVSDKKLNELYNSAFVVAVPSLFQDSFGLSLMEAISCQKPVVSTDSIGIPGISGELIVKKNDPNELAVVLEKLLLDKKFYATAKNTAKEMSTYFLKEKVMESYLEAYSLACRF